MASVHKTKDGYRVHYRDSNGKQRAFRLGKSNKRQCDEVCRHIEELVQAKVTRGTVAPHTQIWLSGIGDRLHKRLVNIKLTDPRQDASETLQGLSEYMDAFIARGRRKDGGKAATNTIVKWKSAAVCLREFFGHAALSDITPKHAMDFRIWLEDDMGHAENTFRKHIQIAKLFYNAAIKERIVVENPFNDLPSGTIANRERDYFVTIEETTKCLEAASNGQWRLIIALCRYGGVRCPSEIVLLTWDDVLWHENRMIVHSPKTQHHEGQETRVIPIFPELKPYLEQAYEDAPPGTKRIIRGKTPESNLRTTFSKIIERAGLVQWPKLFQNLRASRETELLDSGKYPAHVIAAWMGHSVMAIACSDVLKSSQNAFEL
ncbi:MAG TPA: hypothetical protein EYQ63_07585, partial [Fuerstia sp.]|nr:hypothetical protein [Fuerstiella sp.]